MGSVGLGLDYQRLGKARLDRKAIAKIVAALLVLLAAFLIFGAPAVLPQGRQLSVSVLDAASGEPLQGASVLLLQEGKVIGFKRTRQSGNAVFSSAPKDGTLSLKVEAQGYADRQVDEVAENNEVSLAPQFLPSQTQLLKQPEQPEPAFQLGENQSVPELDSDPQSSLSNLTRESKKLFEQQLQAAPQTTPPDCTQITSATPTPAGTPEPTATPAATQQATPAPTQAPESTVLPRGGETEFSIKFEESHSLEGNSLRFKDYTPGGSVMLSVTPKTGAAFTVIFTKENNSTEIAGIKVELIRLGNETPPTSFFRAVGAAANGPSGSATGKAGAGGAAATVSAGGAAGGAGGGAAAQSTIIVSIDYPWENGVLSSKTLAWGKAAAADGVYAVEVSTDGGRSWKRAEGGGSWAAQVDYSAPGRIDLLARAIDCRGRVQEAAPVKLWGSSCKAVVKHGEHENKFDLAIIPSKYGSDFEKFSSDAQAALEYAFSTPPLNTLQFFSAFNIFFYNGEAECSLAGNSPPENRAWKCEVPPAFHESCTFADLAVVFVNSELRAGKSGNPIVASAGEKQILLHELGHSVFGLADEYCCDGGYWHAKPVPNIYSSKKECEAAAGKECELLGSGLEWAHPKIERGLMEALEKDFFDETDLPAAQSFFRKYGG